MKFPWDDDAGEGTDYERFQRWELWAGKDASVAEMLKRFDNRLGGISRGDIITIYGLCERVAEECNVQKT